MFSQDNQDKSVDVLVTLTDGRDLQGSLMCGLTPSISKALNSEGQFVELVDTDGHPVFIAKHQIATLEPVRNAGRAVPNLRTTALEGSRWHEVLGVSATASFEEVRAAYHSLAKKYHPDLYSEAVPAEMRAYASAMFMSINKAYEAFETLKKAA